MKAINFLDNLIALRQQDYAILHHELSVLRLMMVQEAAVREKTSYTREQVQFWRDDIARGAAELARRAGCDQWLIDGIEALAKTPANTHSDAASGSENKADTPAVTEQEAIAAAMAMRAKAADWIESCPWIDAGKAFAIRDAILGLDANSVRKTTSNAGEMQ